MKRVIKLLKIKRQQNIYYIKRLSEKNPVRDDLILEQNEIEDVILILESRDK